MRVLVTRALDEAERTGSRLGERGHEALIAPLTAIHATGELPPSETFDALIVTSLHGAPYLSALPQAKTAPVFAVGPRTAEAVRAAGAGDVRVGEGDAVSLIRLIPEQMHPGAALLHIAGRDRKPEPEASLVKAGYAVRIWPAYEATAAERLPQELAAALTERTLDVVLHYSRRSALILRRLAEAEGLLTVLLGLHHVFLSQDVAEAFPELGSVQKSVAAAPDELSLLAELDEFFSKTAP